MTDLVLTWIGLREDRRRAAVRGDDGEPRQPRPREDDPPIGHPRGARAAAHVAHVERIAAVLRHFVDLPVAEEPDPRAIGRCERPAGALGPGERPRVRAVQPPQEQPRLTLDLTLVDDEAPVVGDGDVGDARDLRRRVDGEPDDRIRTLGGRRRGGHEPRTGATRRRSRRPAQPPQLRATASTRRMATAPALVRGLSPLHVGNHDPRVGDVVEPVRRIALEAAPQQDAQLVWRPGRELRPVDLAAQHGREGVGERAALERPALPRASRRPPRQTPRCPCACPPPGRAPAPGPCTRRCRESRPVSVAGLANVGASRPRNWRSRRRHPDADRRPSPGRNRGP